MLPIKTFPLGVILSAAAFAPVFQVCVILLLVSTLIIYPLLTPLIAAIKVSPPTPDVNTVLKSPAIWSLEFGLAVPIPTLPLLRIVTIGLESA